MAIGFVARTTGILWRVFCFGLWFLLGAWTALAAFFTAPFSVWPASMLALAIGLLYWSALPERFFPTRQADSSNRLPIRSLTALVATAIVAVWYFYFVVPNPNEDWITKHARMPRIQFVGDEVRIDNVRDYMWQTETEFVPSYVNRVYDVSKINFMYFVISPIFGWEPVSHVWVGFGFTDGQHVDVSVEARGVKGRPFGFFRSMFRQFQLIYVIGEERDVIGFRAVGREAAVRFFPVRTTPERMRALFLDIMKRACSLDEHPEFYNLFANNCMNNVTNHIRRLGGRALPADWRLLITGFSDRLAYDYGFLDTNLPFEKAREAYRIDKWMRQTTLDDTFSLRLREHLRQQGADCVPP